MQLGVYWETLNATLGRAPISTNHLREQSKQTGVQ